MINLALRTEYSFKKTFQHIDKLDMSNKAIGIADLNGTYGYVDFSKTCKKNNVKPIFGVRLMVVNNPELRIKGKRSGNYGPIYIFIAKNVIGLQEIYKLIKIAYDNFYYHPNIGFLDMLSLSDNVIVIASEFKTTERIDYIALTPHTRKAISKINLPKVFINDNYYPSPDMKGVYQLYCGARKTGTGYNHLFESHAYPQHISSEKEFMVMWNNQSAIDNTYAIADMCNVELPKAEMVKYKGNNNLINWCILGARKRGIDLENDVYADRLEREIELIKLKDYGDYFLNVAEIIKDAKNKNIFCGPARGSSAGSLVCYLMGITEVDPIKHGLLFERFIDVNRNDLPDIDIDFPDKKRESVIKGIVKKHGENNVAHISNIIRFKPKSAINDFGIGLRIPGYELEPIKGMIIERLSGEKRAKKCLEDTLNTTEAGIELIKKYPNMELVKHIEGHAQYAGTHAAGVIICNEPIYKYAGLNTRDNMAQVDKKSADYLNLLKIDCLGLTALSIIEECCNLVGVKPSFLYNLPLDNKKAFDILNERRFQGIFQFNGQALQQITKQIGAHEFNDIVAITALARPGAMESNGLSRYIKYKKGLEKPVYINDTHKRLTEETYSIVVYQETMMFIAKEIGNLSWNEVTDLRKATAKSMGADSFNKFRDKFIKGAINNGINDKTAENLWDDITTAGKYSFNKSHSVSYALISYWTMYLKAHHPLEFAAANLNNTGTSNTAIKILRDMVENEGIEYVALDPDESNLYWTIHNGKLIGGLTSIKGIGIRKAQQVLKARNGEIPFTPSLVEYLINPITVFSDIFPCKTRYEKLYTNPSDYGLDNSPSFIKDVNEKGEYTIIGKVIEIDLKDRNDYQALIKRDGKPVDKYQFYLKMFVEDDTDQIMIMISPQDFDRLNGRYLSENLVVDESWLLIKGSIKTDWRMLGVSQIFDLTDWKDD